jgi:histidine decarboxylase
MTSSLNHRIEELLLKLQDKNKEYLGYPLAKDFSFSELAPFLNLQMNNVGDPYTPSSLGIDTKDLEKEVLAFFSSLLRAQKDSVWGYVTNGGSEGNLYGLYLAREIYPNGMFFYSESTHYSVKKNLHLLGVPNIVVRSKENGEMDYEDLKELLPHYRHKPAIFIVNVGTTMKEAIDQLGEIKFLIKKYALKDFYIHCDAALTGIMAPFHQPRPEFDFTDGIDSISISGHKFIGAPIPCGVVMCKKEHSERVARMVSYVGTRDTTITGSRNGFTPLLLWYALKKMGGYNGLKARYEEALSLAKNTTKELKKIGWVAWKNPNTITVVIDKPNHAICQKYQLAVEGDIAHIICMPGTDKKLVKSLILDLQHSMNAAKEGLSLKDENEILLEEF